MPSFNLVELLERAQDPKLLALIERVRADLPDKPTYYDYTKGLRSLMTHITSQVPQLLEGGQRVVDIGPGTGTFLILARAMGNTATGEELQDGTAVHAYQQLTAWWNLSITHHGFHLYVFEEPLPYEPGSIDLFHFRGTIDGVLYSLYEAGLGAAALLPKLYEALTPGGRIWIGHNQDSSAAIIRRAIQQHRGALELVKDEPFVTELVKL